MMTTLDGFIEGPNGEMQNWLPSFKDTKSWEDLDEEMWNNLKTVDTLLLGRVAYQAWEKFWPAAATNPSSTENDIKFSHFADETPKVVFSRTLREVGWKNTRLVSGNIADEIHRMKQEPGKTLALVGGAGIAQSFMKLGLIDEFLITVFPVVLSRGKPLFKDLAEKQNLKLVGTREFKSGAVGLHYHSAK